jgi:hypothetical protein
MPFSGYLVSVGRFKLAWVGIAGAIGCNAGSLVAYYVGALGGRPLVEKYGRYVLVTHHDLELADRFRGDEIGDPGYQNSPPFGLWHHDYLRRELKSARVGRFCDGSCQDKREKRYRSLNRTLLNAQTHRQNVRS